MWPLASRPWGPPIWDPRWLGWWTPPRVNLHLTRQDAMVVARGEYETRLALICSRCLGEAPTLVKGRMETIFLPRSQDEARETGLDQDEMDLVFYEGEEVDLGPGLARRDKPGPAHGAFVQPILPGPVPPLRQVPGPGGLRVWGEQERSPAGPSWPS